MDVCFKCGKSEDEIKLFDGIDVNQNVKTCERCSLIEAIPIVKIPSTNQLKNSEKTGHVYKRLRKKTENYQNEKSTACRLSKIWKYVVRLYAVLFIERRIYRTL